MTVHTIEKPSEAKETAAPPRRADTASNVNLIPHQTTPVRPVGNYLTDEEYDEMFNNVPV